MRVKVWRHHVGREWNYERQRDRREASSATSPVDQGGTTHIENKLPVMDARGTLEVSMLLPFDMPLRFLSWPNFSVAMRPL